LAAGLRPDPLGELTALPETPSLDLRVPTSKGRGDEREGWGRRKGRGEGEYVPLTLWGVDAPADREKVLKIG